MENEFSNQSVLKTYYSKYLTDVRGLSNSSVAHYLDALNNISRRLKDKGLVSNDIYEVSVNQRAWRSELNRHDSFPGRS